MSETTPSVLPGKPGPWAFPLALGLLLVALLATTPIGNYDLGTDLKTGQWILEHRSFPQKDAFTYTCGQNDYLDGKVLYQTGLYLLYRCAGYKGLSLAATLAVLSVFLLLGLRLGLASTPPWLACLLGVASALALERRFFLRSEIASWVLLSLTLWVLELRLRRKKSPLWALPLLQWVWANTEGLFILGWGMMGAYGLVSWVHQRKADKQLLAFCGLSVAASLLNPYGLKLWGLPFLYFSQFQYSANSDLVPPLRFLANQNLKVDWNLPLFLYFAFSLSLAWVFATTWRQRKIHEWILALSFFGLSCMAYRNIPLFLLVAVPFWAEGWKDWASSGPRLKSADLFLSRSGKASLFAALALLLLCLRVATGAYYVSDRRQARVGLGLEELRVPVKAVDFLNQNHLDGRMLNYIGMGDWLIWQWAHPVFIDGRQQVISPGLYGEYRQSFRAGGLEGLVLHYQPQLIALPYNDAVPWAVQLKFMSDWRLIYADGATALYARKDYAPRVPAFAFSSLLGPDGPAPDPADEINLVRETRPSRWGAWFSGFVRPPDYPMGLMSEGLFALHYGDYGTADHLFAECLRRAGGGYAEIFYNLGVANLHLGRYKLGKLCLQKAFALDPGNPETTRMLEGLRNY